MKNRLQKDRGKERLKCRKNKQRQKGESQRQPDGEDGRGPDGEGCQHMAQGQTHGITAQRREIQREAGEQGKDPSCDAEQQNHPRNACRRHKNGNAPGHAVHRCPEEKESAEYHATPQQGGQERIPELAPEGSEEAAQVRQRLRRRLRARKSNITKRITSIITM